MKRMFLVFAIISTMAGCTSVGHQIVGHQIDLNQVSKIKEGSTTKQQVYDLIGKPDEVTNMGAGDAYWSYSSTADASKARGYNMESQYFMIVFGPDNIVKKIIGSHSTTESDFGVNTGSKGDMPMTEERKRPK